MKFWHPSFVVVLSSLYFTSAEIFSSMNDLEKMLNTQATVIYDIQEYINKEKTRILQLERTLAVYEEEHVKAMEDTVDYLGNPINLFRLIKRLSIDLDTFEDAIENRTKYCRNKTITHPELTFPNTEDLIGAAKSMVFLVKTYRLNITELAQGTLVSGTNSTPMSSDDCYEMARILFIEDEYKYALPWFMEALRKYQDGEQGYNFTDLNIIQHIMICYTFIDDSKAATGWLLKLLEIAPHHLISNIYEKLLLEMKNTARSRLVNTIGTGEARDVIKANYNKVSCKFEALCRGEIKLNPDMVKSLFCWYSTTHHPYLMLAPIKVEQLHIQPDVFIFHQVISDDEIEHIQNISRGKLFRSRVNNGTVYKTSEERISKICWLDDSVSPVVARITQRVKDMTGLSMDSAENLQVANYGIAGHYVPHYDYSLMSEVAQGGATVFLHLGLTVFPIKNAALYWRNLHPSGEGDRMTLHSACPVLKGTKWAANKWIHFKDQVFTHSGLTAPYMGGRDSVARNIRSIPPIQTTQDFAQMFLYKIIFGLILSIPLTSLLKWQHKNGV